MVQRPVKSCFLWSSLPPIMTYPREIEISAETKDGCLQRCCSEALFMWQKENADRFGSVSGASFLHHSALEVPRQRSLRVAVRSLSGSGAAILACYAKPQAHIFRQPFAGHRSFPKTLGKPSSNLCWLCVGVWVSSREHWKQQPHKGWLRSCFPGSIALQSAYLKCKHGQHVHVLHMLYLQAVPRCDILRYYEIFSLNLCTAVGSQILQNYVWVGIHCGLYGFSKHT